MRLKRLLCLLFALLLLTGCVDPHAAQTEETEQTESVSVPTGEDDADTTPTAFGLAYVPEYGFNPYDCTCITNRPVLSLVYEPLFVVGNNFQPEPVLCDRFAVSENGKEYVLTLCPDITFSDGSPMTASDVVASLEAARDSDYYGSRFSKVSGFTATDESTVTIDLSYAYENLPLLLDVPIVKAGTQHDERPVGSGPYTFFDNGLRLSLLRSSGWWQDRNAPVEYPSISLTAAANPTEIRDSFEFGATSLVCADLNSPAAVGYRCDYELWDCPTATMQYIGFNLGAGMFTNRQLRAAVTHVIDRESISSSIYKGFAQPAYLPCSPDSPLYDDELAASYGYDPGVFRTAFVRSGVSYDYVGTLLVCSADPSRVEAARRISESMAECGVKLDVVSVDYDSFRYRLKAGQYDMFIGEARLSATFDLTEFFRPYGSLCYGGIQSSGMERLCRDALENSGNCYDLYKSVMENAYFCPLLFKSYAVMANRGVISNLQPAVDNVFHLAGGRSLADATVSYEELTDPHFGEPEEPTETEAKEP